MNLILKSFVVILLVIMCVGCIQEGIDSNEASVDINETRVEYLEECGIIGEGTTVEIFYIKGCGGCEHAKGIIKEAIERRKGKVSVVCYDPRSDEEGMKKANEYNISYVPSIVINGELILRGYEEVIRLEEFLGD